MELRKKPSGRFKINSGRFLCSSSVEQLESAENHQCADNYEPYFRRENKGAKGNNSDNQHDQAKQFDFSGLAAAASFIIFHSDHFLISLMSNNDFEKGTRAL
jgi:hypothetical protein